MDDWLEWAEPLAYGPLNLKPQEFEQLQPSEFLQLWDGYIWRKENNEDITAYFVCHIMNLIGKSLKRNITPKDLLKPLRREKVKEARKEESVKLKETFKNRLKGR